MIVFVGKPNWKKIGANEFFVFFGFCIRCTEYMKYVRIIDSLKDIEIN